MYIQRSLVPGSISGSGSTNAQNCGSEQAKTKFASNPLHCIRVFLGVYICVFAYTLEPFILLPRRTHARTHE